MAREPVPHDPGPERHEPGRPGHAGLDRTRLGDRIWSEISPTMERPRSAVGLRMVLAAFGLVVCSAFAVVAAVAGWTGWSVVMGLLALIAVADLGVLIRRRRGRGRQGGPPVSPAERRRG
ncbi:DUF6343 family protein [Sinosporangium siamense]|uniref:Uncharacterized protein n=1 Tax=Sinosporangium siamense TaxID=1367973 RepID=A0A919VDS0_9ACTN|nr:DUF6343 family protein [Sinosporangium siamense]GII94414.1 hypothetical protein Ssi02_46450 [Sinosporangium siamense]